MIADNFCAPPMEGNAPEMAALLRPAQAPSNAELMREFRAMEGILS